VYLPRFGEVAQAESARLARRPDIAGRGQRILVATTESTAGSTLVTEALADWAMRRSIHLQSSGARGVQRGSAAVGCVVTDESMPGLGPG